MLRGGEESEGQAKEMYGIACSDIDMQVSRKCQQRIELKKRDVYCKSGM
jgi:hypothetical protein